MSSELRRAAAELADHVELDLGVYKESPYLAKVRAAMSAPDELAEAREIIDGLIPMADPFGNCRNPLGAVQRARDFLKRAEPK